MVDCVLLYFLLWENDLGNISLEIPWGLGLQHIHPGTSFEFIFFQMSEETNSCLVWAEILWISSKCTEGQSCGRSLKGYICLFLLNLTLVKAINQAAIFSFIAYALKLYNFFGPNFILVSVISLSTYIETDSASTTCVFVSYHQHEQAQALSNIYW